jgi:hypothetical protein
MNTALFAGTAFYGPGTRVVSPAQQAYAVKIQCFAQSAGNQKMGSSETIRAGSKLNFNEWAAGLIDGDGYFYATAAGYTGCEVTALTSEVQVLHKLKAMFGGSISSRSASTPTSDTVRWRLHNKQAMLELVLALNGEIQLEKRYQQFVRVCGVFSILPHRKPLTSSSSWFIGFFDARGFIGINPKTYQPSLSVGQKTREILDEIVRC